MRRCMGRSINLQNRIEMNTSFERSAAATDEWYTPKEIIDSLGKFDLDPCAPINPLWQTAKIMYNKSDDGLTKEWAGRVWLNPPYSRPLIGQFVRKLAEHGNGIALLFNRCDSKMFQDIIFEKATAMKSSEIVLGSIAQTVLVEIRPVVVAF